MVRQDRTRRHRAWRLYLSSGPEEKAHAIHPPVQQATQAREVEVLRHSAPNYSRINRYSPLVPVTANREENAKGAKSRKGRERRTNTSQWSSRDPVTTASRAIVVRFSFA